MRDLSIFKNRKIYINTNDAISFLIAILIVYKPILNALNVFTNLYFPNTPFDTLFFYIILAILILIVTPKIITLNFKLIIISTLLFLSLCLVSLLINIENLDPIKNYFKNYFFYIFPYLFLGFAIKDYSSLLKYLKMLVPVAITFGLFEYVIKILTFQAIHIDNMPFAYSLLPSVLIAFFYIFKNWRSSYLIWSIIGAFLLIGAGTRGPIICLIVYISLYLVTHLQSIKLIISTIILTIALLWIVVTGKMIIFLNWLGNIFLNIGVSTRIFEYLLVGNYFDLFGRDVLINVAINSIIKSPIIGYGVFGDRTILSQYQNTYVHNIFFEMLSHFGIIFGLTIFLFTIYLIITTYLKNKRNYKGEFILILIPIALVKLVFSSSYLEEPLFFLLIGICITGELFKKKIGQKGFVIIKEG